ncbi:2-oxoacid:acceptor oxidoreductase subunit alpha [bacterium]|nr:2-oxoacid:acceptor oxidoreductase subunit alpha [bacterium]
MNIDYSILIGGAAGLGSRRAGLLIAKLFSALGYYIFIYDDYQSLIRGGHSFSNIRISVSKKLSSCSKIDFLIALDQRTWTEHQSELKKEGILVYNSDKFSVSRNQAVGIPAQTIVQDVGGRKIMENIVLVAGLAKILGIEWKVLKELLTKEFNKHRNINLQIAKISFRQNKPLAKIKKIKRGKFPLLTGNEAIAQGAVKSGLSLYFAYPMTPATGILHYLAEHDKRFRIKTIQLENEIAVINAALGSAYAGAPSMVGTSGGGFALMTEALSLACQAEIPLVIINSQRAAPASGVPTYTAQGDLSFALTAGHGDIVKFLVAPGDAEESCYWAGKLLSLSWQYQTPSVLLVDKQISESTFSFDKRILEKIKPIKYLKGDARKEYMRYQGTKSGISPLLFPGKRGVVVKTNSYEHNEAGITIEDELSAQKMQDKRLRKYKEMKKAVEKVQAVKIYGNQKSSRAILAWGSTKGPAKEAAEDLNIKMIQPLVIQPFPEKQIKKVLEGVKNLVLIEGNALGQLGSVLTSYGIKIDAKILKYNTRPFLTEEIKKALDKIWKNEKK